MKVKIYDLNNVETDKRKTLHYNADTYCYMTDNSIFFPYLFSYLLNRVVSQNYYM